MTTGGVERPRQGFRWAVAATAASAWALVVVGGAVRVSESGLGCPDWPLCGGRVVPAKQSEPIVEYAHRATAAVVIALLAVTAVWALRRYRSRRGVTIPLVVALGLVPVQAVLGAIVVWLELPDRLVGVHFMVGMVMLALCMHACVAAWRGGDQVTRAFRSLALTAGAASLALVSLGASVVSTDGMHACGEQWPGCNGGVVSGDATAVLQVVHRFAAYTVVALAVALLVLGLRGHAPLLAAVAPAVFGVAQVGVGIGMVLAAHGSLLHDVLRILHVTGAAALWASMVAVVSVSITPTPSRAPMRRAHEPVRAAAVEAGRPT